MRLKNMLLFGTVATYPVALHLALTFDQLRLALVIMGLFYLATIVLMLNSRMKQTNASNTTAPILVGLSVSIALLALFAFYVHNITLLYLPPIAINLGLMLFFLLSLTHSDEALISRIARMERGSLNADLIHYTRSLTWIWTILFALMAAESLLLALFAPLEVWSWFTNILNYVFVATLFVGEYIYRRFRFRHEQHASPLALFRMLKNGGWQRALKTHKTSGTQ